ncbi:MAG: hydroxymethylglutaryl-CoA lyase [Pseudomonadota bacterium]
MSRIEIVEVGPRDGLQSEPEIVPTEVKAEFVQRSLNAGIKRMEVTSFVHPKLVPQMADAEALLQQVPAPPDACFIGLALNEKGCERAIAAGVTEIGFVVVASDTFNRKNQRVSSEESLDTFHRMSEVGRAAGVPVSLTISAAWGCPYEGFVDPDRVLDLMVRGLEARPSEIGLADTIGVAVPRATTALVSRVVAEAEGLPVRCHFHNTRNTGIANALAAAEAGATRLDASTGGIGGCPFAPAATGNIATEDLLYALHHSGFETGVDLNSVVETALWLDGVMGKPVPSMLSRAGDFSFEPRNEAA